MLLKIRVYLVKPLGGTVTFVGGSDAYSRSNLFSPQKVHDMLKKGWDVEGSPFKGQKFDPSMFDIPPGAVQFWCPNRVLVYKTWLEWRVSADFATSKKNKVMSQSEVMCLERWWKTVQTVEDACVDRMCSGRISPPLYIVTQLHRTVLNVI